MDLADNQLEKLLGQTMARPRIFVSSTYYDLKHIRASLEAFIDSFGYESVLFESGDIAFKHDQPLDKSCYDEISTCQMLILIVGGRYGSATSESYEEDKVKDAEKDYAKFNSITKAEYETARSMNIPVFIFVDKNVLAEHHTYKKNRENSSVSYAFVDSLNIFKLLDEILDQRQNNFIRGFEKFDDIASWLRDQWAGLLFNFLTAQATETRLRDLAGQIEYLKEVTTTLRESSLAIVRTLKPKDYESMIENQEKHLKSVRHAAAGRRVMAHPAYELLVSEILSIADLTAINTNTLFDALSGSLDEYLQKIGVDRDTFYKVAGIGRLRRLRKAWSVLSSVKIDGGEYVGSDEELPPR